MTTADQPEYYSDGIDPVRRTAPTELFLVTIEVRPDPDSDEYGYSGGAIVNCWVDADDLRTAERRSVALIQRDGWRPHRFDSWSIVTRESYIDEQPDNDGPDLREIVDQAFSDGEVCVFHTWPLDAPDAEDDA